MTRAELIDEIYTDHMTRLPNRRAFDTDEAAHAARYIVALDVEGLKYVNDTWGPAAGDALIRGVAEQLKILRLLAYRVGGDEFVIRFTFHAPNVSHLDSVLARLEAGIERMVFSWNVDGETHCAQGASISIGWGQNPERAFGMMNLWKKWRTDRGFRSPRGLSPFHLRQIAPRAK
jgi:diguanylate cyclase (GGDEF)-like protein